MRFFLSFCLFIRDLCELKDTLVGGMLQWRVIAAAEVITFELVAVDT